MYRKAYELGLYHGAVDAACPESEWAEDRYLALWSSTPDGADYDTHRRAYRVGINKGLRRIATQAARDACEDDRCARTAELEQYV
jgi:hypothetical protein